MMLEGSAAEDSFFHMQNRKPVASHIFHTTAAWLVHVVERQNPVREVVDLRPWPHQHSALNTLKVTGECAAFATTSANGKTL